MKKNKAAKRHEFYTDYTVKKQPEVKSISELRNAQIEKAKKTIKGIQREPVNQKICDDGTKTVVYSRPPHNELLKKFKKLPPNIGKRAKLEEAAKTRESQ